MGVKCGQVGSCAVKRDQRGSNGLKRGEVDQVVLDMYSQVGLRG